MFYSEKLITFLKIDKLNIMSNKQIKLFTGILYSSANVMILIGVFFEIYHYPNGLLILIIGIILGEVANYFKTSQLKNRVKELEELLKLKE